MRNPLSVSTVRPEFFGTAKQKRDRPNSRFISSVTCAPESAARSRPVIPRSSTPLPT